MQSVSTFETISPRRFREWLREQAITENQQDGNLSFSPDEYMFRVPIGDYRLQLDYRLSAAFSLLPLDCSLILHRRGRTWGTSVAQSHSLETLLRGLGVLSHEGALLARPQARGLVYCLAYLTNRWGRGFDSLYLIPDRGPQQMLYCPGSPESIFVMTPSRSLHDHYVERFRNQSIPVYGPAIPVPLSPPIYEDIRIGDAVVRVDPSTGKPIGPGSEEASLDPAFLPRECVSPTHQVDR